MKTGFNSSEANYEFLSEQYTAAIIWISILRSHFEVMWYSKPLWIWNTAWSHVNMFKSRLTEYNNKTVTCVTKNNLYTQTHVAKYSILIKGSFINYWRITWLLAVGNTRRRTDYSRENNRIFLSFRCFPAIGEGKNSTVSSCLLFYSFSWNILPKLVVVAE